MIQLLILIPVLGSLFLLPIKELSINSQNQIRNIALIISLINFFVSIILWIKFDSSTNQIQFVYEYNQLSFCHFNLGIDGISLYYVLLTTFLTPIALLSNYKNITENVKTFVISFLILESLQICLFTVLDLFLFYIFFESILPILFVLIIVYGSGQARIRSAYLFFLYTFAGSLFMLLAILQIYSYIGSTDFQLISLYEISLENQKILFLAFLLAFAIKTPLWPFTGWLYRAHADSPLAGSILLAGTVLKFATYGYIRVLLNILPDACNYFGPLLQTIAIVTLIYASLATIIQGDTKVLIAYSSIAHMAVVILGLFSNNIQGIEGAILLSLAHGFVSPALFICVGGVIYDRTGTRIISYIRGLVTYMPVFTILFFIFTLCNSGIPLSLNFLGEFMSLAGMFQRNPIVAILAATSIVFSGCYSIYLYNRISYGVFSPHLKPIKDVSRREYMILISLLIPTILLGIYPNIVLEALHLSVTGLLFETPLSPLQASPTPATLPVPDFTLLGDMNSNYALPTLIGMGSILTGGSNPKSDSKALVLWGSNLHYGLNWKNFNRGLRNMYQLPATQYFMLIGIILSDGHISKQKSIGSINGYLEFSQSFDKFYYVFYVFSFIGHYCNRMPKLKIKNWLSAGKQKQHFSLRVVTRALPCFTELHDLFYINGKNVYQLIFIIF